VIGAGFQGGGAVLKKCLTITRKLEKERDRESRELMRIGILECEGAVISCLFRVCFDAMMLSLLA
jgi:hypothetical protein